MSYCLTAREFDPVKIVYPFELEANPLSNFYLYMIKYMNEITYYVEISAYYTI